MLPVRRLLMFLPLLLAGLGLVAPSHAGTPPSHVQASLVSADASIQPGQPVTVALRLVHNPHWHTYWINPGTGLPTSLTWKLPPGWTAGPIQWPAPIVLKDKAGATIGNGYEGELLLPVTLTPPADLAPGTAVRIAARADWLMCEDVCIPGNADVAVTLSVAGEPAKPDPTWSEKIRATIAALPRPDVAWKVVATQDGKIVRLQVTPTDPAAVGKPAKLHFFAEENFVNYDQPQRVAADGRGGFLLTLAMAPDADRAAKKLRGVLTADGGWLPGGKLRGLQVDTAFSAASAIVATAATSSTGAGGSTTSAGGSGTAAAGVGLGGTLLLAFVGGLILNLMPCVFPVLGLKILGFVNQAGHQRSRIVTHGLIFTAGVLLSFWALATVLAVLRAGGDQLGWGFQLQSPVFVFVLAVLLLVFGMNMSGVFEFGLRATAVGGDLQQKSGYAGSFFTGVLATVVATPCSAPFLAPALGAALAVSTVESFAIFTAIALGLSLPYLVFSIFPGLVKILPRPGAWMETFKQFMAFPLYGTVGALIWVLAAQTSDEGFLNALLGLVAVALAVWIYGRWTAPGASAGRVRFGVTSLVLVGAAGLWLGWPRTAVAQPAAGAPPAVVWDAWSSEAVAKLRAEGRIVYVDFTARWCATCQTNKRIVFSSNEVLQTFADKKVATLRADWTKQDPRITAELAAYQRSAVPFNVIWVPGQDAPVILPELLTPGIVLDALKAIPAPAAKPAGAVVTQAARG